MHSNIPLQGSILAENPWSTWGAMLRTFDRFKSVLSYPSPLDTSTAPKRAVEENVTSIPVESAH